MHPDDARGPDFTNAHLGEHVVHAALAELLGQFLEADVAEAETPEFLLHDAATGGHVLLEVLAPEPVLHLMAGPAGGQVAEGRVEPVTARAAFLHGQDLDPITGLECMGERYHAAVDLGAAAAVADLGVDLVGEVDGRGPGGQIDDLAGGGEYVDPIGEHRRLELVDELAGLADLVLPFQQLAQPGDFLVEVAVRLRAFLVAPVGGHAVFAV